MTMRNLFTALALVSLMLSGCATSTFKVPPLPKVTVTAVQYTEQIRPLVLVVETVFADKLSPTQLSLIRDMLTAMDAQAGKETTIDVLPVILAVGAPALGNQIGKMVKLTKNEQVAAELGLALLTQLYGEQPAVKTMLPLLSGALNNTVVILPVATP